MQSTLLLKAVQKLLGKKVKEVYCHAMFSLIPFTDSWATVVIYPPAIFSAKACSVFVTQLRCP